MVGRYLPIGSNESCPLGDRGIVPCIIPGTDCRRFICGDLRSLAPKRWRPRLSPYSDLLSPNNPGIQSYLLKRSVT